MCGSFHVWVWVYGCVAPLVCGGGREGGGSSHVGVVGVGVAPLMLRAIVNE